ncbi:MAG TPA: M20/M25/M40 family metallo-hydrolase [Polyangiaceae bacterium]|nr:M20/M25/M40 family metallo-hydrolase [Polyangiaceae bacterium]
MVRRIATSARGKKDAWNKLEKLTDGIGHRLSGTPELDRAIGWAVETLKADGHDDVHTEKVMVPHWERGAESLELVGPQKRALAILGLGGTVATPKQGVEGEVVVVHDWAELEKAGASVKDKIVLYDVPMRAHDDEKGSAYGEVVGYRWNGAARAAKLGAKAVLVRSLATASLRTPHTGGMGYEDGVAKIPAASIAVEDSMYLARLVASGQKVTVRLKLGARMLPDAPSANVVAELRGREKPNEVVILGAHLDSWDVGQGAQDDGAGCVIVMQALTTLRAMKTPPRRTIRVVLFTNEENGGKGGEAYAKAHEAEIPKIVAALESDFGGFAPDGFTVDVPKEKGDVAKAYVSNLARGLDGLGPLKIEPHFGGSDIEPLVKKGAPGVGFLTKGRHYFDVHHSEADTLDKVDPDELADDVAAVAGLAWALAESEPTFRDALSQTQPAR